MSKRTPKPQTPRVVDSGPGWRIEFDRESRDYAAIDEAAGLLGYGRSETAARTLISRHITGGK